MEVIDLDLEKLWGCRPVFFFFFFLAVETSL